MCACIAYIIDKLKENGFNIKYTHPNFIMIHGVIIYTSYIRQDYKKKTGITLDGFGNTIKKKAKAI